MGIIRTRSLLIIAFGAALAAFAVSCGGDAIREFGVNRGEPITQTSCFLFLDGKYIHPPYVVERRGLDIYINDILVLKGPKWPSSPDPTFDKDPGDPPPGFKVWGPHPNKWPEIYEVQKCGYLLTHYDLETAQKMYFDVLRKCPDVKEVYWRYEGSTEEIVVVDKSGRKATKVLSGEIATGSLNWEDVLANKERKKAWWEGLLGTNDPLAIFDFQAGMEAFFSADRAFNVLDILLSEASRDEKIKACEESGLSSGAGGREIIITQFKAEADPRLAQRLEEVRRAWHQRKLTESFALSAEELGEEIGITALGEFVPADERALIPDKRQQKDVGASTPGTKLEEGQGK